MADFPEAALGNEQSPGVREPGGLGGGVDIVKEVSIGGERAQNGDNSDKPSPAGPPIRGPAIF